MDSSRASKSVWRRFKDVVCYEPKVGERVPWYWFPFKNRYCRLVWYSIIVFATTLVYYGWQQFSQMLFMKGAYIWACAPEEQIISNEPACDSQDSHVQALYQVGMSSEFIVGLLAGVCLDRLGPLVTIVTGELMFFCGWMLITYSKQSLQLYIPGMIFLAGAINMIAFPTLVLGDFFPSKSGLAMSLVVACQTAGTAITPILKAVWDANPHWSFDNLVWGYLLTVWLPCTIIAIFTLPVIRPSLAKKGEDADEQQAEGTEGELTKSASSKSNASSRGELLEKDDGSEADLDKDATTLTVAIEKEAFKEKSFWKLIITLEYVIFTLYYVCQLLQFGYYPTTVLSKFGTGVSDFQGSFLPTQGVWGVLFGLAVDYTGTLPLCLLLVTMMTAVYILCQIMNTNLQYFTSVLFVISNAYIYTVKYTYVSEIYPSTNFGVLVGLIGFVGGCIGLLNIPISATKNYHGISSAYIAVGCFCYLLIGMLMVRKCRGYTYKKPEEEDQQKEEAEIEGDGVVAIKDVSADDALPVNGSHTQSEEAAA